jgi:tRNA G37 N-methylase TrmD
MAVSDARRLKVYEQAREHRGEETAEVLMELVVPAGQDMATKADIEAAVVALCARMDGIDTRMEGLATKEYVLTMLLVTQIPVYLGILGLYFPGS